MGLQINFYSHNKNHLIDNVVASAKKDHADSLVSLFKRSLISEKHTIPTEASTRVYIKKTKRNLKNEDKKPVSQGYPEKEMDYFTFIIPFLLGVFTTLSCHLLTAPSKLATTNSNELLSAVAMSGATLIGRGIVKEEISSKIFNIRERTFLNSIGMLLTVGGSVGFALTGGVPLVMGALAGGVVAAATSCFYKSAEVLTEQGNHIDNIHLKACTVGVLLSTIASASMVLARKFSPY